VNVPPAALASRDARLPTKATFSRFNPALLARRPPPAKFTLNTILDAPRSYADQVIVPTGMYHLARPESNRPGGPQKYFVSERKIESINSDGIPRLGESSARELALEPELAARLDALSTTEREKVAILTLWVDGGGNCRLVKVQILQNVTPKVARGYGPGILHLQYDVLSVTPTESKQSTKADDAEWEHVSRLLHFANYHKNRFKRFKRMLSSAEQNQVGATMGNMFGQIMRNFAAQEAQAERTRQQMLLRGR
jgi:hypothetical protein